jgi:putative endonuclease
MNLHTQNVGRQGERLAEAHLLEQGARLLARNYRVEYAEVDLLFEHEGDIVAVEVKCRDVGDLEQPEETIRWQQLQRIVRALTTYAMDNDLLERPWRVDVVLIVTGTDGEVLRLDHLRSVYPA